MQTESWSALHAGPRLALQRQGQGLQGPELQGAGAGVVGC